MERKLFMQFEFRTRNEETYWLPVFFQATSFDQLAEAEVAIIKFLNKHFRKVTRYYLHEADQSISDMDIINEYIRNKREGEVMLFTPALKYHKLEEIPRDTAFRFTNEMKLKAFEGDDLFQSVVSDPIPAGEVPVCTINSLKEFPDKEYLVIKLDKKVPAYLRPEKLMVFDRTMGFLTGLIIAMALVLMAFNWRTTSDKDIIDCQFPYEEIIEEMVPITTTSKTPPPPPPKPIINKVNVVNNTAESVEEPIKPEVFKKEIKDPLITVDYFDEVITNEKETPFTIVEDMPAFPGCERILDKQERKACTDMKLLQALVAAQRYPPEAVELHAEGTVHVAFVIEKDGSIDEVEVLKGVAGARMLDREALRLIKTLPKFFPGMQQGRPVRVKYHIPVNFRLK